MVISHQLRNMYFGLSGPVLSTSADKGLPPPPLLFTTESIPYYNNYEMDYSTSLAI